MDRIITLISDWKLRDAYIGMFKGTLIKHFPEINILDITHSIDKQNIEQTAFILRNSFRSFPNNSIHLILTGLTTYPKLDPIILFYEDHIFIGQDNGIFSMLVEQNTNYTACQFQELDPKTTTIDKILQLIDLYFQNKIERNCKPISNFLRVPIQRPFFDAKTHKLSGKIMYIDSFCNAITNIPTLQFLEIRNNNNFTVSFGNKKHVESSAYYDDYNPKEYDIYLTAGRFGYIEITINHGELANMTSIWIDDAVEITFNE
ncbi:MAG: SAM-dependent chlorinase/fluorinase [Bacteroidales bacterium]|jgi:S-adenosylmethionine hydrolase|nr:SAM-dependent chlorinase/fluorinase [Bacteroidales bacterium]